MPNITRIQIKGSSGYVPVRYMFSDKLTVTRGSIRYVFTPELPTEDNPPRTWSYTTDSPVFAELFDQLSGHVAGIIASEDIMCCKDLTTYTFTVTYDDKTRKSRELIVPSDTFALCFAVAKRMVPACEPVPRVLMTSEDWEE